MRHFPPLLKEYQRARIKSLLSHDKNQAQSIDFQQEQALTAIGSGGITGKGFGHIPVGFRVPEAHNDMIFALIAEQFGLMGSLILLTAYVVLFAAGVEISAATREPFGGCWRWGSFDADKPDLPQSGRVPAIGSGDGHYVTVRELWGEQYAVEFLAAGLLLNIGQNRPLVLARSSFEYE